jgi:hypothetical protein
MQIMAWLGTVLRLNDTPKVAYSNCEIDILDTSVYKMRFTTSDLVNEEKLCWVGLFHNPLIARGFPVSARRKEELGLEAPIQIMAALCGARNAVEHEGGLVLKGFSTLLVPVKRKGKSVHWHLLTSKSGKRIKYNQISSLWPLRLLVSQFDHESILKTRAFLSWWNRSESFLGTQSIQYASITASKARKLSSPIRLTDIQVGFQNFGTLGLGFAIGTKDVPIFPGVASRLEIELDSADDLSICLYDVVNKKAWLVSGTETLLYMAHIKQAQKPYEINGKPVRLDFARITEDGTGSCRSAIMNMASRPLISNQETAKEDYRVKDLISDFYSYLEIIEKAAYEQAPGVALKLDFRKKLQGFDLLELVRNKHPWQKREITLESSHGGWPAMIKRAKTPVLLANDLGELLRPADRFHSPMILPVLPATKDFLAMSKSRLNAWFDGPHHNGSLECNGIRVYAASRIAEACGCLGEHHKCPHLLRLLSKSKNSLVTYCNSSDKGCVIIGNAEGALVA